MPSPDLVALPADTASARSLVGAAVCEQIEANILDVRIAPGQRCSEPELAKPCGVSRTPWRLALHVLASKGCLDHIDHEHGWRTAPC